MSLRFSFKSANHVDRRIPLTSYKSELRKRRSKSSLIDVEQRKKQGTSRKITARLCNRCLQKLRRLNSPHDMAV